METNEGHIKKVDPLTRRTITLADIASNFVVFLAAVFVSTQASLCSFGTFELKIECNILDILSQPQ